MCHPPSLSDCLLQGQAGQKQAPGQEQGQGMKPTIQYVTITIKYAAFVKKKFNYRLKK